MKQRSTFSLVTLLLGCVVASWAASSSAHAQGTLNFATRITGSVDARVLYDGVPVTSQYLGQLYLQSEGGSLAFLGSPVPFRDTPAAAQGYITSGGTREVPGVLAGGTAQVGLLAWDSRLGETYNEAMAKGMGGYGQSDSIRVTLGGDTLPPGNLVGLQGFNLTMLIPEPGAPALLLLGVAVVGISRAGRDTKRRA